MKKKKSQPRSKAGKKVKHQTSSKHPQSLTEFFAQSPLAKVNLDLQRIPDYGRKIKI
ncbi:MAG TPA: hypothetical protein VGK01_15735 [Candidatus Angelobacter sp.]